MTDQPPPVSAEQVREVRMLLASKHECSPTLSRKGRELLDAFEAELQAAQEREKALREAVEELRLAVASDDERRERAAKGHLFGLAAQRTEEIEHREGVAEVYSHDGRYLGCIGEQRWHEFVAAQRTEEEEL